MRTRHPARPSASAVTSPPSPPPTMTIGSSRLPTSLPLRHADPLDLPFEIDARIVLDAPAHRLAERLDVGGAGAAEIDEEIAMHRRHLRAAEREPAAAGGIDELPGLAARRILEGRAAGA